MRVSNVCVAFAADAGIVSAVAIVKRLLAEEGTKRVLVFCGTQGEEHAEPMEELLALKDRHLDRLSLSFVMNREPDEAELLTGQLDAAKIGALAGKLFDANAVREYYVCGSPQLADDVTGALTTLGVDAGRIRCTEVNRSAAAGASATSSSTNGTSALASGAGATGDSTAATTMAPGASGLGGPTLGTPSAPPVSSTPAAANERATPSATETRVEFVMDGRRRSFTMHRDSESILDAADRAGVELPFSCKAGVCSTCRTKLVRGQVEMMQNYALEDWELEQGFILACQSHAKTPEIELTYDEK